MQNTCRSDILFMTLCLWEIGQHGFFQTPGGIGKEGRRQTGKTGARGSRTSRISTQLCAGKQPSLPTLPTVIRTIWAKSVPAPVWYPLTHQLFSSSRPGKWQKTVSENKQPGLQRVKSSQLGACKYAALTTGNMLCNNYLNTCLSTSKHGVNRGRSPFVRANISAWAAAVLAFLPGSQDIPCSRLSETGKLGQHRICRIRPDWLSP